MKSKPKFSQVLSNTAPTNWLSAARFFLFAARDVWFVVALPGVLSGVLGRSHVQVGGFLAVWVIGYGLVQAAAPKLVRRSRHGQGPGRGTARLWALILGALPAGIAIALMQGLDGCLWWSTALMLAAFALSWKLPEVQIEPAEAVSTRV